MLMWTRFLVAVATVLTSAAQCELPREPHGLSFAAPTWMVDLHSEGYSSGPFQVHSAPSAMRQITFGSTNELVVINDSGLCGKSNPVTGFVFDSTSGKLLNKAKWVGNCWPYIFGTAQGHYAAVTNEGIAVYSPGLKRTLAVAPEVGVERISADGRTLGAWKQIPGHAQTYFLDAETLQPTGSQFLDKNVLSIFNDSIAYKVSKSGSPDNVILLENNKSTFLEYQTKCGLADAQFVSSSVLVISGCNRVRVIDKVGDELFSDDKVGYPGNSSFAAASRDGNRFALRKALVTSRDAEEADQICTERVTVYDIKQRKAVFAVDLQQLRGMDAPGHASSVALSPDGSLLATDSEGIVEIYRLP
jgi:hypothetical protein